MFKNRFELFLFIIAVGVVAGMVIFGGGCREVAPPTERELY